MGNAKLKPEYDFFPNRSSLFINEHQKLEIMRNLLYILAVIIIIGWAIGFIGYSAGNLIHILLVIAIISVLLGVIQGRNNP